MSDVLRSDPGLAAGRQQPDPRRWKALALLCVTNFMVILDSQIVILALPSIEKHLHLSEGHGQWVLSAYLLAFGGLLLFGGRLADLQGRRRMYLIGTLLFLVASVLCGAAWTGAMLIGARVLQGVSAAIMAPAALAILMNAFQDGAERGKALACWTGVGGVGATAALLIGGALTGTLGWQWIFYLNLPVAAAMLGFAPLLLAESRNTSQSRAYDPAGAITITLGLTLFIGAIVQAPAQGWTSAPVLGMLAGVLVLVLLFAVVERRSSSPLVPLRMFRSRLFVAGNLAMALFAMTAWGMGTTLSPFAQDVLGYSPLRFGIGTMAMTLMTVVGSYGAQVGVARVGFRAVGAVCIAAMGAGAFLLANASAGGSYFSDLFPGLVIFGAGLGGGVVAAITAAMSSVNEQDAGVASGINTAAFQIGGGLGTGIVASVVVSQTSGSSVLGVLARGFQAGLTADAGLALLCLAVIVFLLRRSSRRPARTP